MFLRLSILLVCLLFATPAFADDYDDISLINFLHTLVRFHAIDVVNDDVLLDEYALATDCDLVENFYDNDFKWGQVRQLIRDSIKMNQNSYPIQYHYDTTLKLSRYDFKNKNFRFTDETALRSVNTFNFRFPVRADGHCNGRNLVHLPVVFNIVVGTPVSINGLPFAEDDAKKLLSRLEAEGNADRTIYVRFNMTVVFIDPLERSKNSGLALYMQNHSTGSNQPMRIDARMDSIEFFEDADHKTKLYGFTP